MPAIFTMFTGIYTYQATFIGLYLLKFNARNRLHDIAQLIVLILTLLVCTQSHSRLKRLYGPLMQHQGFMLPDVTEHKTCTDDLNTLLQARRKFQPYPVTGIDSLWTQVIWLPRDSLNVSGRMIQEVTSRFFSASTKSLKITDANAYLTADGEVLLTDEDDRL